MTTAAAATSIIAMAAAAGTTIIMMGAVGTTIMITMTNAVVMIALRVVSIQTAAAEPAIAPAIAA